MGRINVPKTHGDSWKTACLDIQTRKKKKRRLGGSQLPLDRVNSIDQSVFKGQVAGGALDFTCCMISLIYTIRCPSGFVIVTIVTKLVEHFTYLGDVSNLLIKGSLDEKLPSYEVLKMLKE